MKINKRKLVIQSITILLLSILEINSAWSIPNDDIMTDLLYNAILKNNIIMVKTEIKLGADVNKVDMVGWTPLTFAASEGNLGIVKVLVESGSIINPSPGNWTHTPLYSAVLSGKIEVVKFLLNNNASINQKNFMGETALYAAVENENKEIIKLLIHYGADINIQNYDKKTSFDEAKKRNLDQFIKNLLAERDQVNHVQNKNRVMPESNYKRGSDLPQIKEVQPALETLKKAASLGNLKAQSKLLEMYLNDTKVDRNLFTQKVLHWYKKAALLGDAKAQFNLAELYNNGIGVEKNQSTALMWYKKAAQQGDEAAKAHLNLLGTQPKSETASIVKIPEGKETNYQKGIDFLKNKDLEGAREAFKKAADGGDAKAQSHLGSIYLDEHNYRTAASWFEKAAIQGDVKAQFNLGLLYAQGLGVKADENKALVWFKKSALHEDGDSEMQNDLGEMYANGESVKRSLSEAVKLFQMAAKQGNQSAMDALDNFSIRRENGIELITKADDMPFSKLKKMTNDCFDAALAKKALLQERKIKTQQLNKLKESAQKNSHSTEGITVKNQIKALEKEINTISSDNQCSICFDCYLDKGSIVTPQCQKLRKDDFKEDKAHHFFCTDCFYELLASSSAQECPICKYGECDQFLTEINFDPTSEEQQKLEHKKLISDKSKKELSNEENPKPVQGASSSSTQAR